MPGAKQSYSFVKEVHLLRDDYEKLREQCTFVGPIINMSTENAGGFEIQTYWFDNDTDYGRCIRLYNIPGFLSGDILRLRQNIEGDMVRPSHELLATWLGYIVPLQGSEKYDVILRGKFRQRHSLLMGEAFATRQKMADHTHGRSFSTVYERDDAECHNKEARGEE